MGHKSIGMPSEQWLFTLANFASLYCSVISVEILHLLRRWTELNCSFLTSRHVPVYKKNIAECYVTSVNSNNLDKLCILHASCKPISRVNRIIKSARWQKLRRRVGTGVDYDDPVYTGEVESSCCELAVVAGGRLSIESS